MCRGLSQAGTHTILTAPLTPRERFAPEGKHEGDGGKAVRYLADRGLRSVLADAGSTETTWRWQTSLGQISLRLDHICYSRESSRCARRCCTMVGPITCRCSPYSSQQSASYIVRLDVCSICVTMHEYRRREGESDDGV